jgi:glycerol-3-phosphate dehydrogenase
MPVAPSRFHFDIAIIGGGVAGLWLANRLANTGYSLALFESKALGSDQTVASQGMIHGGMKYTLSGTLTSASEAIAEMPRHWRACLCGEGDVDLRNTRILSDHFFMWSSETMTSRLTTFLASKLTRGRVEPVADDKRPPLLRNNHFSGSLYRLEDLVLDVPSLVTNLANNLPSRVFQVEENSTRLTAAANGEVSLITEQDGQSIEVTAQRIVLTAGKGNAALLQQLGLQQPAMQVRPLQQVMVKHHYPHRFYGHCLGAETTPRLTISSHTTSYGAPVWYLGGSLAERGVHQDAAELIENAKQELADLMPWLDFSEAEWATLPVERAEPLQRHFARPDNAFATQVAGTNNLILGWPTKLTLAPNLANEILALLNKDAITPGSATSGAAELGRHLMRAPIAKTPWDIAFPPPPDSSLTDDEATDADT